MLVAVDLCSKFAIAISPPGTSNTAPTIRMLAITGKAYRIRVREDLLYDVGQVVPSWGLYGAVQIFAAPYGAPQKIRGV